MIPLTRIIPETLGEIKDDLADMYKDIAQGVNGTFDSWTPAVYGSTTAGTPTYSVQDGWYYRQGVLVDLFIRIAWTNVGGAAGNITMRLPFSAIRTDQNLFNGTLHINNSLALSANYEYASLLIPTNSNTAVVEEHGAAQAGQTLTFAVGGTGGFYGHIRYISQDATVEGR